MSTDRSAVGRWWCGGWARSVYVVTGVAFGTAVALTSANRGSQPWQVWAALAIALSVVSGAVFGYGLVRWTQIVAAHHPGRRPVAAYLARVYGIALAMLVLASVLSSTTQEGVSQVTGGGLRGLWLVTFAGMASVPVVAALGAVYEHARVLEGAVGQRAETVLALRRLIAGLLLALGSQVSLATLALGAAREVGGEQPDAVVLVFGGAWSVVIALAYVPAAGALRTAAWDLCRTTVPLADVQPGDLPGRVEERRHLEQALSGEGGALADVRSGILVLSPLVASAASLFLPD